VAGLLVTVWLPWGLGRFLGSHVATVGRGQSNDALVAAVGCGQSNRPRVAVVGAWPHPWS